VNEGREQRDASSGIGYKTFEVKEKEEAALEKEWSLEEISTWGTTAGNQIWNSVNTIQAK